MARLSPAAAPGQPDERAVLEDLLRIDRAGPQKAAVKSILAHPLSVRQQVEAIRMVDREKDADGALRAVKMSATKAARNRAERMSLQVKRRVPRASALHFFFSDLGSVARFGRASSVLSGRLLPPWVRPHPQLARLFASELRVTAFEIGRRLGPLLENGWESLTPQQYNLLAVLKRLTEALCGANVLRIRFRGSDTIDRLARVESLFLMLHYDPRSLPMIFRAIRTCCALRHGAEGDGEHLAGLALKLLAEDCSYPSLYNCILGLNMLKYRRFLSMKDLLVTGLGSMVDTGEFDFAPSVREKVEVELGDAVRSVRMLHNRLREVRATNGYLSVDSRGHTDLGVLKRLYESVVVRPVSSFTSDQENVLVFASRLARCFHEVFGTVLTGACDVEGAGRVEVFSSSLFSSDVAKLLELTERIEQLQFRFFRFPLARYLRIRGGELRAIGEEEEIIHVVSQAVEILVDVGKAISRIVGLRSPASGAADRLQPLEPETTSQGQVFSIPFEASRIRNHSALSGMTVLDALREAVSMCFAVGVLFRDKFLLTYFSRTRKLEHELDLRVKSLQKLAGTESLGEIVQFEP